MFVLLEMRTSQEDQHANGAAVRRVVHFHAMLPRQAVGQLHEEGSFGEVGILS